MVIKLLWMGVCRTALSLYQNGIHNVLILINYYAGTPKILIQYFTWPLIIFYQRMGLASCLL